MIRPFPRIYFDPLDVFRWVAESFRPIELMRSYRHPQGYYVGLFRVTWDGEIHNGRIVATARRYSYTVSPRPLYDESRYGRQSAILSTAMYLIRGVPGRDSAFHLAQNIVLQDALQCNLNGYEPKYSYEGRGSYGDGNSVNIRGTHITVERRDYDGLERFTVYEVMRSILSQLEEPQQLRLFG